MKLRLKTLQIYQGHIKKHKDDEENDPVFYIYFFLVLLLVLLVIATISQIISLIVQFWVYIILGILLAVLFLYINSQIPNMLNSSFEKFNIHAFIGLCNNFNFEIADMVTNLDTDFESIPFVQYIEYQHSVLEFIKLIVEYNCLDDNLKHNLKTNFYNFFHNYFYDNLNNLSCLSVMNRELEDKRTSIENMKSVLLENSVIHQFYNSSIFLQDLNNFSLLSIPFSDPFLKKIRNFESLNNDEIKSFGDITTQGNFSIVLENNAFSISIGINSFLEFMKRLFLSPNQNDTVILNHIKHVLDLNIELQDLQVKYDDYRVLVRDFIVKMSSFQNQIQIIANTVINVINF